jgi:rSAM/selenodomain-associated transferase 2
MPDQENNTRTLLLSVVIPVLNDAAELRKALKLRKCPIVGEIIVADGGSADDSAAVAKAAGTRVVMAPRGRGAQLAAGAAAARGEWLLFLHADCRPAPGWAGAAADFAAAPGACGRAGYFSFALDDDRRAARRLERVVAWRCRILGLPYGDQGLLIARSLYDAVGGFAALPLMEDVDLVRRIGRERLVLLDAAALGSARRYLSDGYLRRPLRNLLCLSLYFAGVPPQRIARLYG